MGFCQWFRHFRGRINVLKLLKLKLIVLVFKQHSSQSQKMVFIYKAFDHERYQWYEFEDSSSFWTKLVNTEEKTSKIRSHVEESRLQVKKNQDNGSAVCERK